ncbi:hypothetical protein [Methanofollis ethanolicus]|uniref:hypothetical protein n=1 Tax=Methanofollis ethanolicus TaxID=488124 RepID=UPI00128EE86A|nr:hypothetical protein [Methanofollis ethanolicus]
MGKSPPKFRINPKLCEVDTNFGYEKFFWAAALSAQMAYCNGDAIPPEFMWVLNPRSIGEKYLQSLEYIDYLTETACLSGLKDIPDDQLSIFYPGINNYFTGEAHQRVILVLGMIALAEDLIETVSQFGPGPVPEDHLSRVYPRCDQYFQEQEHTQYQRRKILQELEKGSDEIRNHAPESTTPGYILQRVSEGYVGWNFRKSIAPPLPSERPFSGTSLHIAYLNWERVDTGPTAQYPRINKSLCEVVKADIVDKTHYYKLRCESCGRVFAALNKSRKFCSPACKQRKFIELRKERNAVSQERVCPICGDLIVGRADKITCGKSACRQAFYRKYGTMRKKIIQ